MKRRRTNRLAIRSEVLTLRMTPEEMLRLKVAALSLRRKRAVIVRERVRDLIRGEEPVGNATLANDETVGSGAETIDMETGTAVLDDASPTER